VGRVLYFSDTHEFWVFEKIQNQDFGAISSTHSGLMAFQVHKVISTEEYGKAYVKWLFFFFLIHYD